MTTYSFLLGAPNQLAAEALANSLAYEGYDVMVDAAAGNQVGGFTWHVGVWFDTSDLQEVCVFLVEAARHHGGDIVADSLEAV
jgi:hypothetical protein